MLATYDSSHPGHLFLDLGALRSARADGSASSTDETFLVQPTDYVDPSTSDDPNVRSYGDPNGQTITLTAFGVTQTYAGVTEIDFAPSGGNTNVTIAKGVTANVNITSSSGSTFHFYDFGSGNANINVGGYSSNNPGDVMIVGGSGTTTITSTASGLVTVTPGSGTNTITNDGTGGTLYVQIPSLNGPTTINGGGSSQTLVYLGSGAPPAYSSIPTTGSSGNLAGILSNLTINGAHNTTVWLDDTASTSARTGTLANITQNSTLYGLLTGLGMGSGGSVQFRDLTALNLLLNARNNTLNLRGEPAGAVNLYLGAGQNQVNVGDGSNPLDNIKGSLTVNGTGNDTLTITDVAGQSSQTGVLDAGALSGMGMGGNISYSGLSTLNVTLDSHGNTFTIANTNAGTTTNVNGGFGVDTFLLQNDTGSTYLTTGGGNDKVDIEATGGTTTVTTAVSSSATIYVGSNGRWRRCDSSRSGSTMAC